MGVASERKGRCAHAVRSGLAICPKRFDKRVRLLLRPTIPDTVASQRLGNERFYS